MKEITYIRLLTAEVSMRFLTEDIGKAVQNAESAVRMAQKLDDTKYTAQTLSVRAWLNLKMGRYHQAAKDLEGALDNYSAIGDNYGYLATSYNMAKLSLATSPLECIRLCEQGIEGSRKNYLVELEGEFASLMATAGSTFDDDLIIKKGKDVADTAWKKLGWYGVRKYIDETEPPRCNPDFLTLVESYPHIQKLCKIREDLNSLKPDALIISGSLAKGNYKWSSDADISILFTDDFQEMEETVQELVNSLSFLSVDVKHTPRFLGKGSHKKSLFACYILHHWIMLNAADEFRAGAKELIEHVKSKYGETPFDRYFLFDSHKWRKL